VLINRGSLLKNHLISALFSSPGAELPLVESFGLLNDLFPFPSILDAGFPVFDLQLANVLFDVILPSVLGTSLLSFS
jgi:hypothetical protein